jgi:hypothetical protein
MRRSRGLEIADWGRGTHKNNDVLVLVVAGLVDCARVARA